MAKKAEHRIEKEKQNSKKKKKITKTKVTAIHAMFEGVVLL